MPLRYSLKYGGVPFTLDHFHSVGVSPSTGEVRKAPSFMEVINSHLPIEYLRDIGTPPNYVRTHGNLDHSQHQRRPIKVGEWFYPVGATRWSVFRGVMPSSHIKEVLRITGGRTAATFEIQAEPESPSVKASSNHIIQTSMRMLPTKPIGEHGDGFDGLHLVTLVDERYYWQLCPFTYHSADDRSWLGLANALATKLGITLTIPSIPAAYTDPEVDSDLWSNGVPASILLDSLAVNVGMSVVRKFDGTYELMTDAQSKTTVDTNLAQIGDNARRGGGNSFYSGNKLNTGSLANSREAVVPANINVQYPKYALSPYPHFINDRNSNAEPSSWNSESYGSTHTDTVPITSGGQNVSGLTGLDTFTITNTAKAVFQNEGDVSPLNASGIAALSRQIAKDIYDAQVLTGLDIVLDSVFSWTPEGFHDLQWCYAAANNGATTRVQRSAWNHYISTHRRQHATPPYSGGLLPPGPSGRPVSLSVVDSHSNSATPTLTGTLTDSSVSLSVSNSANLPTNSRWIAQIDAEKLLMEATNGGTTVQIIRRGVLGTTEGAHGAGASVSVVGNQTHGTNLIEFEEGMIASPNQSTSGGLRSVKIHAPIQTVRVNSQSGTIIDGVPHFSGTRYTYRPDLASGQRYQQNGHVWVVERNGIYPSSGQYYDGNFVGWSKTPPAPLYLVNQFGAGSGRGGGGGGGLQSGQVIINYSGGILSGAIGSGLIQSGALASGSVTNVSLGVNVVNAINLNLNVFGFPFKDLNYFKQPSNVSGVVNGPSHIYKNNYVADSANDQTNDYQVGGGEHFTSLNAMPIILAKDEILSEIGVWKNIAGNNGAEIKIGIYQSKSDTDLYPGPIVSGISGGVTVALDDSNTSGYISADISGLYCPAGLYWITWILKSGDTFSDMPTLAGLDVFTSVWTPLGHGELFENANIGWRCSGEYTSGMPANYPQFSGRRDTIPHISVGIYLGMKVN